MRLTKIIILTMIGISSYIEYAKWQKRELLFTEGIIIYDNSEMKIPMYVIFVPATFQKEKKAEECLEETLSKPNPRGYIIYFQAIRWIESDLGDIVSSLNAATIKYGTLYLPHKIAYGKFTFDTTHNDWDGLPEDTTVYDVPVQLNNKILNLRVSELPRAMGLPKVFEKID